MAEDMKYLTDKYHHEKNILSALTENEEYEPVVKDIMAKYFLQKMGPGKRAGGEGFSMPLENVTDLTKHLNFLRKLESMGTSESWEAIDEYSLQQAKEWREKNIGDDTSLLTTEQLKNAPRLVQQADAWRKEHGPKATDNIDSIIEEEEHSSILSELMQTMGGGEALGPMQGDEQSILGGLTGEMTPSLEERKANIKRFPSFESRGVERFTVPITKDDGSVIEESRSMEHWLQDYDYLYNRTALSKP